MELLTIGHSNHEAAPFLDLLRRHAVEAVADVRSRPFSRFVPHFSKAPLARLLAEAGIGYTYLGRELGGKPVRGDPPRARLGYEERIAEPAFRRGIETLLEMAARERVALLCRERLGGHPHPPKPLDCHRLHLICRHLRPVVGEIRHILPDGRIEEQAATERRLLERAGSGGLPLFAGADGDADDEALERAYDDLWWRRR